MAIDSKNVPFIIAEIGINHNGDIGITRQLIDIAKNAGCDAVKFQKRTIDIVYTREFLDSPRESPWGTTQRAQKEGLEFGKKEYDIIDNYCRQREIDWFASAWDIESQNFIRQYDLKYNKIASPMLTHLPLMEAIAEEGRHTFISTGMSDFGDIDKAVEIFRKQNCPFTLMHCQSTYPAAEEELNLLVIKTLRERYGCDVGYSGHEISVLPPTIAVVLGAVAIERHITVDRAMYGSDQSASLEKKGVELMVRDTRRVTTVLGDGFKRVSPGEKAIAAKLRYFREH
ncbi:N-acetylneuraminate synthase family protein [Chloroflexota bacterium]